MTAESDSKIVIQPGAVVCREAVLEGEVTVGTGTVIQPFAIVRAVNGPIIIGENNCIEERALIENISPDGVPLIIGRENLFDVDSVVQCQAIGDYNVFGMRSSVSEGVIIGEGVSLGACTSLTEKGRLEDRTCIYGNPQKRRIATENPSEILSLLDLYRRQLPSYHHLIKAKLNQS